MNEENKNGVMLEKDQYSAKRNSVSYMSDELGLHRVENTSHSDGAVSLHLYSPPFQSCQVSGTLKKIRTNIIMSRRHYYYNIYIRIREDASGVSGVS